MQTGTQIPCTLLLAVCGSESVQEEAVGFLAVRSNLTAAFASVHAAQPLPGHLLREVVAALLPNGPQRLEVLCEEALDGQVLLFPPSTLDRDGCANHKQGLAGQAEEARRQSELSSSSGSWEAEPREEGADSAPVRPALVELILAERVARYHGQAMANCLSEEAQVRAEVRHLVAIGEVDLLVDTTRLYHDAPPALKEAFQHLVIGNAAVTDHEYLPEERDHVQHTRDADEDVAPENL
mmetsp:Transcript_58081/g.131315  ORF Transcript_58081/g.131315 Transcript_58081/m.131315 type:complete len:238 (-) Transcript_58081:352-1065(-)